MTRRSLALVVSAVAAIVPASAVHADPARARPDRPAAVRFLGSDPVGPLSRADGGVLRTPGRHACRAWAPVGSRWRELDELGRVVGEVRIASRSFYEPSGCDELSVRRVRGRRGAGVYVDARASYVAPPVARWAPDDAAVGALERLAEAHQSSVVDLDPSHPVAFSARARFFAWGGGGQRFAVVGGQSLLVLAWREGSWTVVHEERPPKLRAVDRGFMTLAVTDMNGDGRPEIVVHELEESGEWYGDATLSMNPDGTWTRIGAGIWGSTG